MIEHLYPARPGMLRLWTPVCLPSGTPSVVTLIDERRLVLTIPPKWRDVRPDCDDYSPVKWEGLAIEGDALGCAHLRPLRLDLRDVTARAHAAWAYRPFGPDCPVYGAAYREIDETRREDGPASTHYQVLRRMACGDETVTVAEARAALDWAHAASGGVL